MNRLKRKPGRPRRNVATERVAADIPADLAQELRKESKATGRTIARMIEDAIRSSLLRPAS